MSPPPPFPAHALKGSSLVGETSGRIRHLRGFQKGFREPQEVSAATKNFVSRLGGTEVQERAERIYQELRKAFGYPRAQLRLALADGAATLATPDFDVNLRVDQNLEQPRAYQLVTQVAAFRNPAVVHAERFQELFSPYCNRVVIDFATAFQISAKIDEIEDIPALAPHLDYDAQGRWFTLRLPAPAIIIHVRDNQMTLTLPTAGDLKTLLAHSLSALQSLSGGRAGQSLPGG